MTDPDGFEEYVIARRDSLVRAAYLLSGDAHQAEDLVQAALIRVWPRWHRIDHGDADAYVRRTLFTVFITSVRRRRWRELTADPRVGPWPEPALSDGAEHVERRAELGTRLRALAPRQRAVVVLRYYFDLPEAEAARVLGCSVGTVKSQSAKAMRQLRAAAAVEEDSGREGAATPVAARRKDGKA